MLQHLIEIRRRLLRFLLVLLFVFFILFYFAGDLYSLIAAPLLAYLPKGDSLIAIGVSSTIFAPMKLTLVCALLLSVPVLLYELWGFIAPGLYQHERRWVLPLLLVSTLLFAAGLLFAYYLVLPLVFRFLLHYVPVGVRLMPDISYYLSFVIKLLFAFGFAFEVPVVVMLLVATRVTTCERLARARPTIIVLAFVLGMLLTPPDVVSQVLLALPLWLLFELGLLGARWWTCTHVVTENS